MAARQGQKELARESLVGHDEVGQNFQLTAQALAHVESAKIRTLFQPVSNHLARKFLSECPHTGIVVVQHGGGGRFQVFDQLVFGSRDGVERIEKLQVDGGDIGHNSHLGFCQPGQRSNLTRRRHGQLEHRYIVLRFEPEHGKRHAESVIKITL